MLKSKINKITSLCNSSLKYLSLIDHSINELNITNISLVASTLSHSMDGSKVIFLNLSGSRLLGTETPDSDFDVVGLFIPSLESFIKKEEESIIDTIIHTSNGKFSHIEIRDLNSKSNDEKCIDLKLISIYKLIELLSVGEIGAVDLFFSMGSNSGEILKTKESRLIFSKKEFLITSTYLKMLDFAIQQVSSYFSKSKRYESIVKINKFLRKNKTKKICNISDNFYALDGVDKITESENIQILGRRFGLNLTCGYILSLMEEVENKYGKRTVAASEFEGKDLKSIMHAIRTIEEIQEFKESGHISFPLKNKEYYKKIRNNSLSSEEMNFLLTNIDKQYTLLKEEGIKDLVNKKHQNLEEIKILYLSLYSNY